MCARGGARAWGGRFYIPLKGFGALNRGVSFSAKKIPSFWSFFSSNWVGKLVWKSTFFYWKRAQNSLRIDFYYRNWKKWASSFFPILVAYHDLLQNLEKIHLIDKFNNNFTSRFTFKSSETRRSHYKTFLARAKKSLLILFFETSPDLVGLAIINH